MGVAQLAIEVANALLWILAGIRFGVSAPLIPYLLLFSGLLTDLSEKAQVQAMDVHDGNLFVRTDTVIGMVFGIYGPRALQMLAAYRLEGDDVLKHTIDRYLEALRPNCCTVFPPLVRHDDAFSSTLWKREDRRFVTNEFMNPMIQRSQRRLVSKMIGCLERAA